MTSFSSSLSFYSIRVLQIIWMRCITRMESLVALSLGMTTLCSLLMISFLISYAHRALGIYSSRSFAYLSACIFMSRGYKVFLSRDMCATPLVVFSLFFSQWFIISNSLILWMKSKLYWVSWSPLVIIPNRTMGTLFLSIIYEF